MSDKQQALGVYLCVEMHDTDGHCVSVDKRLDNVFHEMSVGSVLDFALVLAQRLSLSGLEAIQAWVEIRLDSVQAGRPLMDTSSAAVSSAGVEIRAARTAQVRP